MLPRRALAGQPGAGAPSRTGPASAQAAGGLICRNRGQVAPNCCLGDSGDLGEPPEASTTDAEFADDLCALAGCEMAAAVAPRMAP